MVQIILLHEIQFLILPPFPFKPPAAQDVFHVHLSSPTVF